MADLVKEKDSYDNYEIRPIRSTDIEKFKKNKYSQPMPNAKDSEIIDWAKALLEECYNYKKDWHNIWYKNALDYFCKPSFENKADTGRNVAIDQQLDTKVLVPPLVKRYVDLGGYWITRQIFKASPYMQFTSYSDDESTNKAQKLYERKLQGDAESYGAKERSTEIGIDLFLYGNAVAYADFYQERMLVEEPGEIEIIDNSSLLNTEYDPTVIPDMVGDEDSDFDVEIPDPEPKFAILDQYAEFKPIFLGHYIIDPYSPQRDWRRARYMGHVEYMCAEEIMEKFGNLPGFDKKFDSFLTSDSSGRNSTANISFSMSSDNFLKSWRQFVLNKTGIQEKVPGRKLHGVYYLYTKYTETVIIDDRLVVYHRYRDYKTRKAGVYPYYLFRMPCSSGSLFSVGFGQVLQDLQLEQILLASKRLQMLEQMNGVLVQYIEGCVEEDKIKLFGKAPGIHFLEVTQPGSVTVTNPDSQIADSFLATENRNFERAREYINVPGILDSSNTKTHLGAVSERIDSAQTTFDVILDRVRDGFKELYQKIHVLNMNFLEGDISLKGATSILDKTKIENTLSEEQLMLLAKQPDLSIELNVGYDINSDKLKSFAALLNTPFVGKSIEQLLMSNAISPDKLTKALGMLFDLAGLTEFRPMFSLDGATPEATAQPQGQGIPPQPGQPPMPEGIPPEMLQQLMMQQGQMPPQGQIPPQAGVPPQGMPPQMPPR